MAGGLSLQDPAADLSICAALASSLKDVPISPDTCLVGEVGLAGEVRPASRTHLRIREASRLGFKNIVISAREKIPIPEDSGIRVVKVFAISQMAERLIK